MTTPDDILPDHLRDSDRHAGFDLTAEFEPFDQMNDIFTRAFWDEKVRSKETDAFFASYRMEAAPRRGDGFTQRDFALRNASWLISDVISNRAAQDGVREGFQGWIRNDTPVAPDRATLRSPAEEARGIKEIARFFGADLCGITHIDPRWHYARIPDTRTMTPRDNDLPDGLTHVIVMGHEMDAGLVETYPSALAGAATGREYSHEAAIVMQLAAYIRNLGYNAVASMNDTALVIPYAIKAGLGEYGRNQMVLTPEFGPRVRFSKVFTDMPLEVDAPRKLGLACYCQNCTICAQACPVKALPEGPPDLGRGSPSTIRGVRKWSADCEACFGYWAKLKTDCAICMRVCPFNRYPDGTLWHRLATHPRWRGLAKWWLERRRPPARLKPAEWWKIGGTSR
ncbi:reductive dehalogenase [Ponticoccus sp. SC2-23]|uniref:4Fe-4S double cluster binding domain-containing protein n=1 Tax=Alexandriicola marinus TaxID=2081710 RepID=UPI000FD9E872|nr:reductive dehalogenase domain-containing protein [Alexandriicola marinus]MBM1222279.1 reductive dehalogenase [Ponticoccus sp. SC6-9]MBM1224392.1 reductive dehalogenase [Ponticoccus sp. SC6-15]MBM1229828.1 reductive dehalogenase [Ponticoccus sp. SC6-38]MBM1233358.1 reductive dehalogenase [Ponticoccus sp. SC6-45]MBM1236692.1 reductive dehalogenase [Ponticoccus sp. SC6-49]MBM1244736.1 reductive dehalogenase [Ponticoccus sp. SC2-64]MBM1246882.1 reductive dehalogenase [Ponticoccus sp. SC6-42]